jgi:short-subunit dehydrogenase
MKSISNKVILLTGASSGIGKAVASDLAQLGAKVYGTSRKLSSGYTDESDSKFPKMIQLDVCSEESVSHVVNYVLEKEGRIDVLINNAGSGIAGAVEDTTIAESYQQFNTNFFGVLRMCREVLPILRRQQKGLIINIGSVAGIFAIPYQSMYSASKFALEAMTESLRIETKPFGIRAVLIEPGDTKTGFTANRQMVAANAGSVYEKSCINSIQTMAKSEQNASEPKAILKVIRRVIRKNNPPIRVVVGFDYKLMVFAKRLLPAKMVEFVISKMY